MARLAEGQIDVWRAKLGRCPPDHAEVLSADERARAGRFRFDAHRERWMEARALLRLLLGRYLEMDPYGIRLEVNANGKPAVPGSPVLFNVSHTGEEALYAFARRRAVGVDVERLGRRVDVLALAERALGHDEAARLRRLPGHVRLKEFLRSWVRHEAALKCRGGRLGDRVTDPGLSLIDLDVGPAAVAAVALAGRVDGVRLRAFGAAERSAAPVRGAWTPGGSEFSRHQDRSRSSRRSL
jgi:phosphopantetheinyl transferase